jgi:hypothetical protein
MRISNIKGLPTYHLVDFRKGKQTIASFKFDSGNITEVRKAAQSLKKKLGHGKGVTTSYTRVVGVYYKDPFAVAAKMYGFE